MNKIIFKILIGSLLIAIIILWGGQQFYHMKQRKYRQQLENTINDKYLEGKNSIGAFYYDKLENNHTIYLKNFDNENSTVIELEDENEFSQFQDYIND